VLTRHRNRSSRDRRSIHGNWRSTHSTFDSSVDSARLSSTAIDSPTEEGEGRGILWRLPAYSLLVSVASARFAVEKLEMDNFATVS